MSRKKPEKLKDSNKMKTQKRRHRRCKSTYKNTENMAHENTQETEEKAAVDLTRILRRLRADAHHDEAKALLVVARLMHEYATTSDPLTDDAKNFGEDLRTLARGWYSPTESDSVRVQRVDMRHQPWSAEVPRVSGVWWWWHPAKMRQPTIVEVSAAPWQVALYGSPTLQFVGLTRHRVCRAEGGWWAGPLEWDKVPDGAVPHT